MVHLAVSHMDAFHSRFKAMHDPTAGFSTSGSVGMRSVWVGRHVGMFVVCRVLLIVCVVGRILDDLEVRYI